jgi:acetolactate synthase-1/2/3 large subunit
MKKTGAWLAVYALEQLPISHTFGIPGVHNTELYDRLNKSKKIEPVLVTHEMGAAFMADAVSRTSDKIGTIVVVPAAGLTRAMSGIGEAFLDGIPMLVISGGVRRDIDVSFQLHEMDQQELMRAVTKAAFSITKHSEIVSTIFRAFNIAVSGEPGPVYVEIPVDIQLFKGEVENIPVYEPVNDKIEIEPDDREISNAVELLKNANAPGLFFGWGCKGCGDILIELAEILEAPVSTTLQGISVFPGNHPLHTGMGFSRAAVPAAENAFKDCDCLLAAATRFGEIPTGSFGCRVPGNLIHIDINPGVFNKNFPAKIAIQGDADIVLRAILDKLKKDNFKAGRNGSTGINLRENIKKDKDAYYDEWRKHVHEKVNPLLFFEELHRHLEGDAIVLVDDGNHTYLTVELFPVKMKKNQRLFCPADFNCMGYCVPAAIGAKMVNPDTQVIGIVGDGAFLMTGMETLTAAHRGLGIAYFVFRDGELSQISQAQEIPYNRKTCTILGEFNLEGMALACRAAYFELGKNEDLGEIILKALQISANGKPVIVDVNIDYSKRTRFTQGVVKTVLQRFPAGDKARFIGRALLRKVTG